MSSRGGAHGLRRLRVTELSKREWLIGRMYAGGIPPKQIAVAVGIKEHTVKSYIKRVFKKMRLRGYVIYSKIDLMHLVEKGVF